MDETYTPLNTFYTSSAVAEALGITRSAVSDAVKRGTLKPDAALHSPKNNQVPIFRHATIEDYRERRLRQHGNRPLPPDEKGAAMKTDVREDNLPLHLSVRDQAHLLPGLLRGIEAFQGELAYAAKMGLDGGPIEAKLDRLKVIARVTQEAIDQENDVSDRISGGTLRILLAAAELSARLDEEEVERATATGKSTLIIEQLASRARQKREVFAASRWEDYDWQGELRAWGL
jgi:hypothetical protein